MNSRNRGPKRQSGLTLIEVLVAFLILSFGLLGLVGLQARAIQYSVSAEDTNRAALLANEIASTIVTSTLPGQDISLSSTVTNAWKARVSNTAGGGLPNGVGTISTAGKVATITLTWRGTGAASGAANATNKYVTQVILPST